MRQFWNVLTLHQKPLSKICNTSLILFYGSVSQNGFIHSHRRTSNWLVSTFINWNFHESLKSHSEAGGYFTSGPTFCASDSEILDKYGPRNIQHKIGVTNTVKRKYYFHCLVPHGFPVSIKKASETFYVPVCLHMDPAWDCWPQRDYWLNPTGSVATVLLPKCRRLVITCC